MNNGEIQSFDCSIGDEQVSLLVFRSAANCVCVSTPDFRTTPDYQGKGFSVVFSFNPALLASSGIDTLLARAKSTFIENQWPLRLLEYQQQGTLPQQFSDNF